METSVAAEVTQSLGRPKLRLVQKVVPGQLFKNRSLRAVLQTLPELGRECRLLARKGRNFTDCPHPWRSCIASFAVGYNHGTSAKQNSPFTLVNLGFD